MEESISYEDLFSREEWECLDIGEWSEMDDEPELLFGDMSPDGEVLEDAHLVTIYCGEGALQDDESRFEVECERSGQVGTAESQQEAHTIARLHETFVDTRWTVGKCKRERRGSARRRSSPLRRRAVGASLYRWMRNVTTRPGNLRFLRDRP